MDRDPHGFSIDVRSATAHLHTADGASAPTTMDSSGWERMEYRSKWCNAECC